MRYCSAGPVRERLAVWTLDESIFPVTHYCHYSVKKGMTAATCQGIC